MSNNMYNSTSIEEEEAAHMMEQIFHFDDYFQQKLDA